MGAGVTYAEQLKHPKWQRRRLEILQRADFKCEDCLDGETTLHVHHKIYRKGAMAWDYADHELVTLCETCHEAETLMRAELAEWMAFFGTTELQYLIGYAKALYAQRACDHEELRVRRITVDTAEQGESLGGALGLTFIESQHIVLRREPFTIAELETIQAACWKLNRAERPRASSIGELAALAGVDQVPGQSS